MGSANITELRTLFFKSLKCYRCDIEFFVPKNYYEERLRLGDVFYCPCGHPQHFSESTIELLERARADLSAARTQLQVERDQHAATSERMERLKRRAKAGVCPCCKRTFKQLSAHMQNKHPDFISDAKGRE